MIRNFLLWGKSKQKRHPRYLEWRLIVGWDYVASLRFPGPPRAITEKSRAALLAQMPFFCSPSSLTKASFRRFAVKVIAQTWAHFFDLNLGKNINFITLDRILIFQIL